MFGYNLANILLSDSMIFVNSKIGVTSISEIIESVKKFGTMFNIGKSFSFANRIASLFSPLMINCTNFEHKIYMNNLFGDLASWQESLQLLKSTECLMNAPINSNSLALIQDLFKLLRSMFELRWKLFPSSISWLVMNLFRFQLFINRLNLHFIRLHTLRQLEFRASLPIGDLTFFDPRYLFSRTNLLFFNWPIFITFL